MEHRTIIDAWPALSAFAEDIGVAYGTAKAMRRRSSIPPSYWPAAVSAAAHRKISSVTYEALALGAADKVCQKQTEHAE